MLKNVTCTPRLAGRSRLWHGENGPTWRPARLVAGRCRSRRVWCRLIPRPMLPRNSSHRRAAPTRVPFACGQTGAQSQCFNDRRDKHAGRAINRHAQWRTGTIGFGGRQPGHSSELKCFLRQHRKLARKHSFSATAINFLVSRTGTWRVLSHNAKDVSRRLHPFYPASSDFAWSYIRLIASPGGFPYNPQVFASPVAPKEVGGDEGSQGLPTIWCEKGRLRQLHSPTCAYN